MLNRARKLLRRWGKVDRRSVAVDGLTPAEAEDLSKSVMTLWGEWQRLRATTLTDEEIMALESSKEYRSLKRVHQYWGNQARAQKRRSYDRERHARISQGKWSPDDPDRIRRKLQAWWGRRCECIVLVFMAYPELEPMPRAWSVGSRRDPRWITSDDNAGLREALTPHVGQLWAIALRLGRSSTQYLGLTTRAASPDGGRGPELYELDFLQCDLSCQLREEAFRRTGGFRTDEPPGEEPIIEPQEAEEPEPLSTSTYSSMAHHADSLRACWGDEIPERILRHERFMRTGVGRR